jgi:hypothetical protein
MEEAIAVQSREKLMFKAKEYMTDRQKILIEDFEAGIEAEFALCVAQMRKANQSIEGTAANFSEQEQNYANSEIDALRNYWYNRLDALVNLLSWRNPKLLEELSQKYMGLPQ